MCPFYLRTPCSPCIHLNRIIHPSSFYFVVFDPSSLIFHSSSFNLYPLSFILHPPSFILQPLSFHPPFSILHPLFFHIIFFILKNCLQINMICLQIWQKLFENAASSWNSRLQHSGVSASLKAILKSKVRLGFLWLNVDTCEKGRHCCALCNNIFITYT